jgi:hypothetical protein
VTDDAPPPTPASGSTDVGLDDTQSARAAPQAPNPPATALPLDDLAFGIDHLDAIIVFHAGDARVHAAWVRADAGYAADDVTARLRDAHRACQAAARSVDAGSAVPPAASIPSDAFVTLETPARVTFLRRVREHVVASSFDAAMPMGMARLMAGRIAATIDPRLPRADDDQLTGPTKAAPQEEADWDEGAKTLAVPPLRATATSKPPPRPTLTEQDRAKRLLTFAEERAPDPHVVRLRVALRSGLTLLALEHPEALGADAIVLIETAVQEILGIDRSELRAST